eukprot:scaffold2874_cov384-Prasinococcus_capsulatus_cf.AAC.5
MTCTVLFGKVGWPSPQGGPTPLRRRRPASRHARPGAARCRLVHRQERRCRSGLRHQQDAHGEGVVCMPAGTVAHPPGNPCMKRTRRDPCPSRARATRVAVAGPAAGLDSGDLF